MGKVLVKSLIKVGTKTIRNGYLFESRAAGPRLTASQASPGLFAILSLLKIQINCFFNYEVKLPSETLLEKMMISGFIHLNMAGTQVNIVD